MDKNVYLINLSESANTDFGRKRFSEQSDVQKVFSAIWDLESQVNNGGFLQYFISIDGDAVEFAPTALRRVGAVHCASIVEQALRLIPKHPMRDSPDKPISDVNLMDEPITNELEKLDKLFFTYPDDLTDLLFRYVCAHPEEFGAVPQ